MSMVTTEAEWRRTVMPWLIDWMHDVVTGQPEMLLEIDGGPEGERADVVLARLYGHDDQVVRELRITDSNGRVPGEQLVPLPLKLSATATASEEDLYPTMPVARYVLQSGFVEMRVNGMTLPLPPDVTLGPPSFEARILYVRYRRKL